MTCRHENDIRTPCEIDGAICGPDGEGHCAADGVCCNDEKCMLDDQCEASPISSPSSRHYMGKMSPDLVKFLRRLVNHKDYQRRK